MFVPLGNFRAQGSNRIFAQATGKCAERREGMHLDTVLGGSSGSAGIFAGAFVFARQIAPAGCRRSQVQAPAGPAPKQSFKNSVKTHPT
jgi:hypothetical protein